MPVQKYLEICLFQSDVWKLLLVLTVSVGLGLSCFLILVIFKLCSLYKHKVTKPRLDSSSASSQHHQHINLDSEGVDYDNINTQLYTPLPEPKIMQISSDDTIVSLAIQVTSQFNSGGLFKQFAM